jgi:8-oxo-dGTP pyrophosphatase MutT (NUDIX family)
MQVEPDAKRATQLRVSAGAIVRDPDGRVLLQRRSDNGLWGVPGGGVELGETLHAAIVREVLEETGLRVAVERLIGVYSDPTFQVVRYPDGNVPQYVTMLFVCRMLGGSFQTCHETLELQYFDPSKLPDDLVSTHRIYLEDAAADRPDAFIR